MYTLLRPDPALFQSDSSTDLSVVFLELGSKFLLPGTTQLYFNITAAAVVEIYFPAGSRRCKGKCSARKTLEFLPWLNPRSSIQIYQSTTHSPIVRRRDYWAGSSSVHIYLGCSHMAEPAGPGLERRFPSHVMAGWAKESSDRSSHPFAFHAADLYQRIRHGRPPHI